VRYFIAGYSKVRIFAPLAHFDVIGDADVIVDSLALNRGPIAATTQSSTRHVRLGILLSILPIILSGSGAAARWL